MDRRAFRTSVFRVHRFAGAWLCLVLGFVFLTGTASVIAPEIEWLARAPLQAERPAGAEKGSLGASYDAVREAYPEATVLTVHRPHSMRHTDRLAVRLADGRERYVWVDPYDATVTGETGQTLVADFLIDLHSYLLMPGRLGTAGELAVLATAPVLLLLIVSGLWSYPRFWTGFFRLPRAGANARLVAGDLHRLAALWSVLFLLVICFTSLVFLIGYAASGGLPYLTEPEPREEILSASFDGAALDRVVVAAEAEIPHLHVSLIEMPRAPHHSLRVLGMSRALPFEESANAVAIDPDALSVLDHYTASDMSLYSRVNGTAAWLHYGHWGGLASRLLYFVFGLMATSLALLGASVFFLRSQRARAQA